MKYLLTTLLNIAFLFSVCHAQGKLELKDQKDKKVIVYAPACFLDEEYLEAKNMEFVGIPYNLFRRNGQ